MNRRGKITEKNEQLNVNVVGKTFQVREALKIMSRKILIQVSLTESINKTFYHSTDLFFQPVYMLLS